MTSTSSISLILLAIYVNVFMNVLYVSAHAFQMQQSAFTPVNKIQYKIWFQATGHWIDRIKSAGIFLSQLPGCRFSFLLSLSPTNLFSLLLAKWSLTSLSCSALQSRGHCPLYPQSTRRLRESLFWSSCGLEGQADMHRNTRHYHPWRDVRGGALG